MQVNLSVIGKFHTFDLARELYQRGFLGEVYSGYPRFKLRNEDLPHTKIKTFPWVHAPFMTRLPSFISANGKRNWEWFDIQTFERYVASVIAECDVYVGLSGSTLRAGRKVKSFGGRYVCDRGSTHIRFQSEILIEEGERIGLHFSGIDPRVIEQEEREYAEADLITVPSAFNVQSFLKHGVGPEKVKRLPYGVNLSRFHPVLPPSDTSFDVLFVGGLSPRKGVHYIIDAFSRVEAANKKLHLVGSVDDVYLRLLKKRSTWSDLIEVHGAMPQVKLKEVMSTSHAMVLASVEEGLSMVQAQAMACGCPVIATENTGARDLFDDGVEGYIVPIREPDAIAERLQRLADDRAFRDLMGARALKCVQAMGGWKAYGDQAVNTYRTLVAGPA